MLSRGLCAPPAIVYQSPLYHRHIDVILDVRICGSHQSGASVDTGVFIAWTLIWNLDSCVNKQF